MLGLVLKNSPVFRRELSGATMGLVRYLTAVIKACVLLGLPLIASVAYSQQNSINDSSYEDTEFGAYLYSETSDATREELAQLLVAEHPSVKVFMHGLSMGAGIDEVLDAAVRIDNQRSRDFVTSAATLLPLLTATRSYQYSEYTLDDIEEPYSAEQILSRFFDDRSVLIPQPDWYEGQVHVSLSARELANLEKQNPNADWYTNGDLSPSDGRPVFVSAYENDGSVLLDSKERIEEALKTNPDGLLPVVFVFNKLKERSIHKFTYPKTLDGIQHAYLDEGLMLTPTPEWNAGDHHINVSVDELIERFDIRVKQDYLDADEAELWQHRQPRTYGYAPLSYASQSSSDSLGYILSDGMILNRPEKVAVAKDMGKTTLPVSIYYLDSTRVKPYRFGVRGLKNVAQGAGAPIVGISSVPPSVPPGSVPPSPPVPPTEPPEPPICASPPCRGL